MLGKIALILFLVAISGSSSKGETFSFKKLRAIAPDKFYQGGWASNDKYLFRFSDSSELIPDQIILRDYSGEESDIYPLITGTADKISGLAFSNDSRVAGIRYKSLGNDLAKEELNCEAVVYSASSGTSVLDTWKRTKLGENDYNQECGSKTKFLSDGSILYLKIEGTTMSLVNISTVGAKKVIPVLQIQTDQSFPYLEGLNFVENQAANVAAFSYYLYYESPSYKTFFYTIGGNSVQFGTYPNSKVSGLPRLLNVNESRDVATNWGEYGFDGQILKNYKKTFFGELWSSKDSAPIGFAPSKFLDFTAPGIQKDNRFIPLTCMSSGIKRILKVSQELSNGSLLVVADGIVGLLQRTSSSLVNTRCMEVGLSFSKACSSVFKELESGSLERIRNRVPKQQYCNLTIFAKIAGNAIKNVSGKIDIQYPQLLLAKFKTNSKGIASVKLPMKVLIKNGATLSVQVNGEKGLYPRKQIQILNY